jgi:hypothetical protein
MTIVDTSGSRHELTQNVYGVGDVRTGDSKGIQGSQPSDDSKSGLEEDQHQLGTDGH